MHAYLVFGLGSIRIATCFLVLSSPDLAIHSCWHRIFQLSSLGVFNGFLELRICWINENNTAQSLSVVKLRSFDGPLVFRFVALLLTCLSISLATSSQAWMLFTSLSAAHTKQCMEMVNRLKPVHASDGSRSSSMFQ